jgi:HEAT repeat protein
MAFNGHGHRQEEAMQTKATAIASAGTVAPPFRQEVDRLSQAAIADPSASARRQAVEDLARIAREEARDVFTQALQDTSSLVRRQALRALGR